MSPLPEQKIFKRKLGNGELSYFLPSRADGVNDMYLHLGFTAPGDLMINDNILHLWALLRIRHPLLASKIEVNTYNDVQFVYAPPTSPTDALENASKSTSFINASKDELISSYLNGPRTLDSDHLSHLFISRPRTHPSPGYPNGAQQNGQGHSNSLTNGISNGQANGVHGEEFDILIAATHYLGDGMALHNFANDLFSLLAGQSKHTDQRMPLSKMLASEWGQHCAQRMSQNLPMLPSNLELRLPPPGSKSKQAIARAEFRNTQEKLIGGHTFPRAAQRGPRHTVVPTVSFSPDRTKKILKKCKEQGVSISNAIFALCDIVWARIDHDTGLLAKPKLPLMMYSALNMRPYMNPLSLDNQDSYWFLAVGYFNVVLPSFLLATPDVGAKEITDGKPMNFDVTRTFWTRARSAKKQSNKAAKSPFVVSRSHVMSDERSARAIEWAMEDDGKAAEAFKDTPKVEPPKVEPPNIPASQPSKAPSQALIGLSLLGNLDGIYKHNLYAQAGITFHTLTTGSRQRAGAMLLFGYTFAGRLWLSLGYDENGYDKSVVEKFWRGLQEGVAEFLEA